MFYQGDLQSGIAQAVRESKHVVCFVRGMPPSITQAKSIYLQAQMSLWRARLGRLSILQTTRYRTLRNGLKDAYPRIDCTSPRV